MEGIDLYCDSVEAGSTAVEKVYGYMNILSFDR